VGEHPARVAHHRHHHHHTTRLQHVNKNCGKSQQKLNFEIQQEADSVPKRTMLNLEFLQIYIRIKDL